VSGACVVYSPGDVAERIPGNDCCDESPRPGATVPLAAVLCLGDPTPRHGSSHAAGPAATAALSRGAAQIGAPGTSPGRDLHRHALDIYAGRVAANGKSDLLVTRAIRDVGHCGFTALEQENAFADLVNWVENGVKPAGDNVLDAATVAGPSFGCTFTTAKRPYAPACP